MRMVICWEENRGNDIGKTNSIGFVRASIDLCHKIRLRQILSPGLILVGECLPQTLLCWLPVKGMLILLSKY